MKKYPCLIGNPCDGLCNNCWKNYTVDKHSTTIAPAGQFALEMNDYEAAILERQEYRDD